MSDLAELARKIRDTSTVIVRAERKFAQHPEDDALELNLLGLSKRFDNLKSQFQEEADRQEIDICDYRIIPEIEGSYPISGIGSALSSFQEMVSVFLAAIKDGPRKRASVPAEVAQLAALNFGFAYPGSLGFALTIPNERLMLIESDLDRAIESVFQIVKARSTEEISKIARELGVPPIRKVHDWADAHTKYGFTVDIKWRRGAEIRRQTLAQIEELQEVKRLIEAISERKSETIEIAGTFEALNVHSRTFRLEPAEGEAIVGHFAETFQPDPAIPIPSYQRARLTKHTVVHYSMDLDEETWELEAVE